MTVTYIVTHVTHVTNCYSTIFNTILVKFSPRINVPRHLKKLNKCSLFPMLMQLAH